MNLIDFIYYGRNRKLFEFFYIRFLLVIFNFLIIIILEVNYKINSYLLFNDFFNL